MFDLTNDIVETYADPIEPVRIAGRTQGQRIDSRAEVGDVGFVAPVCRSSRGGVGELVDALRKTPHTIAEPCFDDGAVRQLLDSLRKPAEVAVAFQLGEPAREHLHPTRQLGCRSQIRVVGVGAVAGQLRDPLCKLLDPRCESGIDRRAGGELLQRRSQLVRDVAADTCSGVGHQRIDTSREIVEPPADLGALGRARGELGDV